MIGFEYGNTRLRAWKSRLLTPRDYSELTATSSIDQLLGALSDTAYAPDVESAVTRAVTGLRRLDEALRLHLSRTLHTMRSFYEGRAGDLVQLLLERWDLENTRVLLRLPEGPTVPERFSAFFVPAGRLDEAALLELASLPDPDTRIDQLISWGIPSPEAARRLLRARRIVAGDESTIERERILDEVYAERLDEVLGEQRTGPAAVLRARIDAKNLLTALRLRAARIAREPVPDVEGQFLPAGRIEPANWSRSVEIDDIEEEAAFLTGLPTLPGWDDAIERWARHDDLTVLADDVQRATGRAAVARFVQGDPLGFDIPVAYTFAKEIEVRNLRLVGRAITHGIPPGEVAELLEVAA